MATVNTADLSAETTKILKRLLNISSDDSTLEIRKNIEKLRMYGNRIAKQELPNFIESLPTIFDRVIGDAIESIKIVLMDEVCDFLIKN